MISLAIVNLAMVGITCFLLVFYLIRFVFRYKHQYESNPLCTSAVILCLSVVTITAFILPVDVFLVSFVKDADGNFKDWATQDVLQMIDKGVFGTYYALYGVCVFLMFVVIPFLHFLNEESESNSSDRLHNSIKYTFMFAMAAVLILVIGFSLPTTVPDPNSFINKITEIVNTTKFQQAVNMGLSIITVAGIMNVCFYTASGIFSWPIGLLLGTSSIATSLSNANNREVVLRLLINNLQEKLRSGRLTANERTQLAEAENELREIERDGAVLSGYSESLTYKLRLAIRPMQILLGVVFGLLSLFLLASLTLVNIDRLLHGEGPKQGYILPVAQYVNPLEWVFDKVQDYLIIGSMPLLIVTCFMVIATISGIRNLGLWLLVARLYRVKIARTVPQALLYFCITMMVTVLAFNMFLFSMIPQYITFGHQNYQKNGTAEACTLGNYNAKCLLSRTAVLSLRVMSQVWAFGAVLYWWNWVFVLVSTISLFAFLIRGRRSATHGIASDEDEFEE